MDTMHIMKKLEIILKGDQLPLMESMLYEAGVVGYTIIRDVSGRGHQGFHSGRLVFNDKDSLVMIIAVAPKDQMQKVLDGLRPFFKEHSGVVFVSDTSVLRDDYFVS